MLLHTLPLAPHILEGKDGYHFQPFLWELSASVLATPGEKGSWLQDTYEVAGPALGSSLDSWGAGMILPIVQTGKQAPRGLWVLCEQISTVAEFRAAGEAGELCGAGVPSRGSRAPPEPPKPHLRAAHGPDCYGATSPELRTLSQSVSSWLPRAPRAAVRPAPPRLPWRPLVHSFLLHVVSTGSAARPAPV